MDLTVEQIKDLISFAKDQNIRSLKLGRVSVEFKDDELPEDWTAPDISAEEARKRYEKVLLASSS